MAISVTLGLCAACEHARTVASAKGSTFLRCALSDVDRRFARYPRLPVLACAGFVGRRPPDSPVDPVPEEPDVPRPRPPVPDEPASPGPTIPPPRPPEEPVPVAEIPTSAPLPRSSASRQPNLFQRIGGRETVRRVVEEFYDRVERDQDLRSIFPADLAPGREKQALFLEQWLGGEPRYSERYGHPRLRRRHFPFVIDQRSAGRWLRHMGEALRAAGVGEPEIAEILAGLGPLAHHMVNADQPVPREPLGDAFLT